MPEVPPTPAPVRSAERSHVALLGVAACLVLFADATSKELHGTAVFYASLVREILDSGSWMGIYSDARAYLLKPPLVVWSSVASCKLFGLSNFGVTFVSRLAGVGCVLLTYCVMRRWWSHAIAWIAAFVLLTNSTFVQFTATLRMDSLMLLGLLLSLAGWAWRRRRWAAPALFGGITIAVLSKGPLGFAAVPLVLCHAALLRRHPLAAGGWRWSALLLPIVLWYGTLIVLHGPEPVSQLGADTLRATAAPNLDRWQSVYAEYVVKPARRYWPWLPFMALGFALCVRGLADSTRAKPERLTLLWVCLWMFAVVAGAVAKPDHDIRYFYPALPVFGLFAGIAIMSVCRGRFLGSVPALLVGLLVAVLLGRQVFGKHATDTRSEIAAIRAAVDLEQPLLAVGGFPVLPQQPRRQNTHRDWVHFYIGGVPEVLSWSQVREHEPDFSRGVFLTRSRGHTARLDEFDLVAQQTTREMIYAVPR